jgi:hypothetical protein
LSKLSNLNNRYSTDNPARDNSELHITGLQAAQILGMLPDRISRTRFINHWHLEPLQEYPEYIQLPYGDPKTKKPYALTQAINDRILDRHDSSDYEIVPIDTTIHRFLNDHEFISDLVHGDHSATDRKNKIRYVNQIPYTLTECAREYLRICEDLSGRKLKSKYSVHKDRVSVSPTFYFSGYYAGELAYIDLKAAYWQFLWPTTIDMEYDPIRQEIAAEGNITYFYCDQFAKCKPIRQRIHSLYNYRYFKVWKWDERRNRHKFAPSELYFPYNVWYIYDMMNAVVKDIIKHKFTLLHWLTDAAIVPASQAESLLEFLFEEWFLDARLEAIGNGSSNVMNMYKVGPKVTRHYDPKIKGRPFIQLREANIEGLKELRQPAKNGQLPEIKKTKRQQKVFYVATKVIPESEYKPKKRLIAPKRSIDPIKQRNLFKPPENTLTFNSIKDILSRENNES